ncbi:MAG: hypothetical protein V1887_03555 [Candidatus Aenigmatarchaeota archaeon]
MELDLTKLLDGLEIRTPAGKGRLTVINKGGRFIGVSYVYRRNMDRVNRTSSLVLRKNIVLNTQNVYRVALLVSEGSHLRPNKVAKNSYFKFTNTDKAMMHEALRFFEYLIKDGNIKFELKCPPKMSKQQAVCAWASCLSGSAYTISRSSRTGTASCGAYVNKVFLTHIIDRIAEATIMHIKNDKKLLRSWFAGRIDGDGSIHPTYHRIDIAYHKVDEAVLMRTEKTLLRSMGVKFVKDRLLNGKNIVVLQICGLDNMIKLLDPRTGLKNKVRIFCLIKRTKFYIDLNQRFRESLPVRCSNITQQKNWTRYLNGSRRMPLSVYEGTFGTACVHSIKDMRCGNKIIADKDVIRGILDVKRLTGGE